MTTPRQRTVEEARQQARILELPDSSDHAADQMAAGGVVVPDIIATVDHGEVIEEYPQALPLPACLSFYTINGRPVHACWARSLITLPWLLRRRKP